MPGVGPGALSIVAFMPDGSARAHPGAELPNELLFVANNMPVELDLTACRFGKYTAVGPSHGALSA